MKLNVRIVTAGIIIGVSLFACAPPPPIQAGGVATPPSRVAAVCSSTTLLSKVHFLATSPPFSLPKTGFQNAPPIDPTGINPSITQDLTDAFNAAPDFFKNQLCNLTGIYIDRTGCTGYGPSSCVAADDPSDRLWGFRAFDNSGNSAGEFIGTWLGLWRNGVQGHAPVFSKFETRRLQALLNWKKANPPAHEFAQPDTVAMTVLAVLAHEVGHVFWYDAFVIKPDGSPNPGGNQADFTKFCNGTFYEPTGVTPGSVAQGSWLVLPVGLPPNRWVYFGLSRNYHRSDDVDMTDFVSALNQQHYPVAGDLLHGIYSGQLPNRPNIHNGRWASALAAFSPDEDFVETFQLFVLKHANPPLLHSRVKVSGTASQPYLDDIPENLDREPELLRKYSCFSYLTP